MEADLLALAGGRKQSDRTGNEGQLQVALPVGTRRHDELQHYAAIFHERGPGRALNPG